MTETRLREEDVTLGVVTETRDDECSTDNKPALDICRKRKRSDEENEVVEEENDGFKTPTRPENRIPQVRECPPAPRRRGYSSEMLGDRTMYCRRRLNFSPEDDVRSFITDLQWKTTTMTIKK